MIIHNTDIEQQESLLGYQDQDHDIEKLPLQRSYSLSNVISRFKLNTTFRFKPNINVNSICPTFQFDKNTLSFDQQPGLKYTAALDGLRGLAALSVFSYHWLQFWMPCEYGYTVGGSDNLIDLPLLKAFHNGSASVVVFFTISGYALSYRSLRLSRFDSDPSSRIYDALSSSIFRRYFRLFIPSLTWLFIIAILFWLGLNEPGRKNIPRIWRHGEYYPAQPRDFISAIELWLKSAMYFSNPYNLAGGWPEELEVEHWTINVEYRTSMILFIYILVLSRLNRSKRLLFSSLATFWALLYERYDITPFLCGYMLADFDIELDYKQIERFSPKAIIKYHVMWITCLLISLYLWSYPRFFDGALGYHYFAPIFSTISPTQESFYPAWILASVFIVKTSTNYSILHRFLTSYIVQYIGKISFSLYLIHGAILRVIIFNLVPVYYDVFSVEYLYWPSIFLGYMTALLVVVFLADLYTTYITDKALTFAKWFEKKCFAK